MSISMAAAVRARTVLAAANWLTWQSDRGDVAAPYVDEDGTPMLLLDRQSAEELLTVGSAHLELSSWPGMGTLRLSGTTWAVAGGGESEAVRRFRADHADCVDCCGPRRSRLVGIRVEAVEVVTDGGHPEPVDLDAYEAATADELLSAVPRVAAHLNTAHSDDIHALAGRFTGIDTSAVLAATVAWIDTDGIEIDVIDADGSTRIRAAFSPTLRTIDDLGNRIHHLLTSAQPGRRG